MLEVRRLRLLALQRPGSTKWNDEDEAEEENGDDNDDDDPYSKTAPAVLRL